MKINERDIKQQSVFYATGKTSGFEEGKDQLVSLTVIEVNRLKADPHKVKHWWIKPTCKIAPEAKAEFNLDHDTCEKIMMEGQSLSQVQQEMMTWMGDAPLVLHGTMLERFAPWLKQNRLSMDLLRLSKHMWPKGQLRKKFPLEGHKVAELKYWLELEPDVLSQDPTHPLAEAVFGAAVLNEAVKLFLKQKPAYEGSTWEAVARKEQSRIVYPTVPYGAQQGKKWEEVESLWLEKEMKKPSVWVDDDIRLCLEEEWQRRHEKKIKQAHEESVYRRSSTSLFSKL